jgi:hypothetical protein
MPASRRPSIELSMIVKDGAASLERCLKSASSFVDRIVIGDTGSTDGSQEIARACGAEVIPIPWENHFSRARNLVIKQAKCDWILVLDADEMLDSVGPRQILEAARRTGFGGFHNMRWNYVQDRSTRIGIQSARKNPNVLAESVRFPGYVPLPTTRLFVAHPEIYYEGCVHETVTRRLAAMNMMTAKADFLVHHLGHAEDLEQDRKKKDSLYLVLGVEKLKENPDDAQAFIEMGVAELDCSKKPHIALGFFEHACELSPLSAVGWMYTGVCLARVGRPQEAIRKLERAYELGLRTGFLFQAFGDAYFAGNQFAEANEAYAQVAGMAEASPLTEAKRGACEVQLGLVDAGLQRVRNAVADAPAYLELYDILATTALLAQRLTLAVETVQARLALGSPTEFHVGLVAAIQAQCGQRGPIEAA